MTISNTSISTTILVVDVLEELVIFPTTWAVLQAQTDLLSRSQIELLTTSWLYIQPRRLTPISNCHFKDKRDVKCDVSVMSLRKFKLVLVNSN